jgi:hypothetical protein
MQTSAAARLPFMMAMHSASGMWLRNRTACTLRQNDQRSVCDENSSNSAPTTNGAVASLARCGRRPPQASTVSAHRVSLRVPERPSPHHGQAGWCGWRVRGEPEISRTQNPFLRFSLLSDRSSHDASLPIGAAEPVTNVCALPLALRLPASARADPGCGSPVATLCRSRQSKA